MNFWGMEAECKVKKDGEAVGFECTISGKCCKEMAFLRPGYKVDLNMKQRYEISIAA